MKSRGLKHINMERICKELAGRLVEGNFITMEISPGNGAFGKA